MTIVTGLEDFFEIFGSQSCSVAWRPYCSCKWKEVKTMTDEEKVAQTEGEPQTTTPQTEPGTDPLQDASGTGADALGADPKEQPQSTTPADAEEEAPAQSDEA